MFVIRVSEIISKTFIVESMFTLLAPTPQNDQTCLNNSAAFAEELFQFVSSFCWVGA